MPTPSHLEHIGNHIKTLRKYRNLSQIDLAEAAVIRQATLSDIEAGKANFEINTLIRIATALNCALDISFTPIEQTP